MGILIFIKRENNLEADGAAQFGEKIRKAPNLTVLNVNFKFLLKKKL